MTKYLDKTPFGSKPATQAYRDGWDAVFGAKETEPDSNDRTAELEALFRGEHIAVKDCSNCLNRCMDPDDTYCAAVNSPWGQTLTAGIPTECGPTFKLWSKDTR
jgi:hypothetical protein